MRRREFLSGTGLLLAALATGCGTSRGTATRDATASSSPTGAGALLKLDNARAAAADAATARGRFIDMGASLFRAVAAEQGGNTVVSPYSVVTALGMTAFGARGATADVFRDLLGGDPDEVAAALTAADAAIAEAVADGTRDAHGDAVVTAVDAANMLWAQSGMDVQQQFLASLASGYAAGMRVTDFIGAPDPARVAINSWVADRTHDLIPALLPPNAITPLTRLVLVNALYLKASWMHPFDKDSTEAGSFTTAAGATVQTDLMHAVFETTYAESDGWRSAQLPYAGGGLAMTVALPDEGEFEAVGETLGADVLGRAAFGETAQVTLTFPTFGFRTATSLQQALGALGAADLFAADADLSGIAGAPGDLVIGDVIHEARVIVDEKGTEAAAATAVVVEAGAAPGPDTEPRQVELVVDRPFYWMIHDTTTLTPLFVGQVVDPTGE